MKRLANWLRPMDIIFDYLKYAHEYLIGMCCVLLCTTFRLGTVLLLSSRIICTITAWFMALDRLWPISINATKTAPTEYFDNDIAHPIPMRSQTRSLVRWGELRTVGGSLNCLKYAQEHGRSSAMRLAEWRLRFCIWNAHVHSRARKFVALGDLRIGGLSKGIRMPSVRARN